MQPTDYNTQLPLVIFGIGNPGEEYIKSRHNLGMMCVQNFAKSHNFLLRTLAQTSGRSLQALQLAPARSPFRIGL